MKIIELFGGIGACSAALKRLCIDYEIADYVEIDKYAVASYNEINGTNFEPQDITKWDKDFKDIDLIMHGSPCQDFSLAGKNKGGDQNSGTRSSLMYETLRIVSKIKPKYVVWENVKNLLSEKHRHNFDNYLNEMSKIGYYNFYSVLNAKDYGIPQNRERVFTVSIRKDLNVAFEFPKPYSLEKRLKDFLEPHVDEKYFLSEKMLNCMNGLSRKNKNSSFDRNAIFTKSIQNANFKGIANTITTAAGHRASDNFIIMPEKTKKGYTEAQEGDGVYINRPEQKRGVVQKGMIQTIKTSPDIGVVVKKVTLKNQLCNDLVKSDLVKEFDVVNHSYTNGLNGKNPNSRQKLEDYIETTDNSSPCLTTRPDTLGVVVKNEINVIGNYSPSGHDASRIVHPDGIAPTVKENHGTVTATAVNIPPLRIRKLTPKECWRLMGFNDEEYEKASKLNSTTQLYKQAGNSIVVNVLVEIFKNLLLEKTNNETIVQLSIFDFI